MYLIHNSNIDYLNSVLPFLLSFFLNKIFNTSALFLCCVAGCPWAWEEHTNISTGTGDCSELHEVAAFINASVIPELASASKSPLH